MFEEILREINRILGSDYALFWEFYPQEEKADEVLAVYKNIGMLRIETGTLQLLQGNQGMQVDTALHLLMRIEDTDLTSKRITDALNALVSAANGYIETAEGNYNYVFSFGLPRRVAPVEHFRAVNFVPYVIPLNITVSQELVFGDDIQVTIDNQALDGIISWQETPSKTLRALTMFNVDEIKNAFEMKTWSFTALVMYKDDNSLHNALLEDERAEPHTVHDFVYKIGNADAVTKKVYASVVLSGQRREFDTLQMQFSVADEEHT
nr:MAG TPA: hypothetical protein [Caudoviricetes sp.]